MTQQTAENDAPARDANRKDRWVKLGFLAMLIVLVVGIHLYQRKPPSLTGWSGDLDASLVKGRAEGRRVLVFFLSAPSSEAAQRMVRTTLARPQNTQAIAEANFIKVQIPLTSLKSVPASRYNLKKLPTMLILDSAGRELNRREGFIGETAFRNGFLDLTDVRKP